MILYLTDNPYIRKKIPGAILTYQIYDWRVNENEFGNFIISKKRKLKSIEDSIKISNEIICIINRSNYRLISELHTFNKKITFYYWDTWEKRKEVLQEIDKTEFNKYLQRSFFTSKIYNEMTSFNFRRIEQLTVFISLNKTYSKKEIEDIKILGLINDLLYKRNSISFAIDKLIYHGRKVDILDPFTGDLIFLKEENSLFKLKKQNKEHPLMKYIYAAVYNNIKIMPFTDIIKTLRHLEVSGIIQFSSKTLITQIEFNQDDIMDFLNTEDWKIIYESGDFSMFNLLPTLSPVSLTFKCPECSFVDFKSSQTSFWCANKSCSFRLDRVISPAGKAMRISVYDFLRILKHQSTIIKNKMGGYNNYHLVKNGKNNGSYHLIPQIKKNDVKPE